VKLTTHLHPGFRSRVHGAITPLPNTHSWCGAQLKHRGNFTFTFTFRTYLWLVETENCYQNIGNVTLTSLRGMTWCAMSECIQRKNLSFCASPQWSHQTGSVHNIISELKGHRIVVQLSFPTQRRIRILLIDSNPRREERV